MVAGNVAFNNPEHMRVGDSGEVEAILSIDVPPADLINALTAAGKKEATSLMISDHMQASLNGGGAFDVAPAGPQTQWVAQTGKTTWHWLVTPKLTGKQLLVLTVDALITINSEKDARNITTLTRQIDVEVSKPHNGEEWFAQIRSWGEDFGWGWAAVAAIVSAVIGAWRKLRSWRHPKQIDDAAGGDNDG